MRHHRITRPVILGLTFAALSAPAAVAQQDLRMPDTRDAAAAAQSGQDLRSPDVRDHAEGRGTFNAPDVAVVKLEDPAPSTQGGGIDWQDAAFGSLIALVLVVGAGGVAVLHRRHVPTTG